ncbi:MAG: hypothetical protein KJ077_11170 [Anaerolineae bacterium]|nr:hypothetical protein [Anaerolineae bacterium]
MQLVKNPQTQQVYLDNGVILMGFDGSPYARPDAVEAWPVVSHRDVPSGEEWLREPGYYGTNYGLAAIATLNVAGETVSNFTAGGPTNYINNWVRDVKEAGLTVSLQWLAAYDDRNAARAAAQVAW